MSLTKGWLASDGEFIPVIVHEEIFSDDVLRAEAEGTDDEALEKAYDELMVNEEWIRVDSEGNGIHGTLSALQRAAPHIENLLAEKLHPNESFNVDVIRDVNQRMVTVQLLASDVFEDGFVAALEREIRSRQTSRAPRLGPQSNVVSRMPSGRAIRFGDRRPKTRRVRQHRRRR